MKLHLPYRLYRALLVALASVPTWIYATPAATVPEGYTEHCVSTVDDVTPYAGNDKQAFLLEQGLIFDGSPTFNTSLFFTSADAENLVSLTFQNYNGKNVWAGEKGYSLTLQGLSEIAIQCSQKSSSGLLGNRGGNVLIKDNSSLVFDDNKLSLPDWSLSSGGVIYNGGEFSINGNNSVSFSGNSIDASDPYNFLRGAINSDLGTFTISGNDSVVFSKNSAFSSYGVRGGAIYTSSGEFFINGNDSVSFSGNSAFSRHSYSTGAYGGAIYSSGGTFTISGNGSIVFSKNSASSFTDASGGAIYNNSSTFTISGNVTFSGNYATSPSSFTSAYGGAIYSRGGTFTISGNVTFSGNYATSPSTGIAYGGAIYSSGTFTISGSGSGSVSFSGNYASSPSDSSTVYGGAIYSSGTFTISGNDSVTFSENSSSSSSDNAHGGAIFDSGDSTFTISGNGSVVFEDNKSSCRGGAIHNDLGTFTISGNGSVGFSWNSSSSGGAIYNNSSTFTISGNGSVVFEDNRAFSSRGGAIHNSATFTISGNDSVGFNNNVSQYGGAIYNYHSDFTISGNDSVGFNNNVSQYGGAIHNSATFAISDNDSVVFNHNISRAAYGGAIYGYDGIFSINSNDSVSFTDNSSGIDSSGSSLIIANNGTVRFSGNEGGDLTFIAKNADSKLTLSARPGGSIEFNDEVSITKSSDASDFQVSYNPIFEDEQGEHAQTGDIVFAGKNSGVSAMSNLYDGRLIIKDGAVYEGYGITVHASVSGESAPTLRLKNGQLVHSGYGITVESGAVLELAGVNTATASSLTMQEGSRLNVYVGTEHAGESALTLTGSWVLGGTLDINLLTDEAALASGSYRLLTLASGQTPESWTADRITVSGLGATFNDTTWDGSTLYLNYTELTEATWTNAAGDRRWSKAAINWVQGERSYAYQDGVEVVFGDAGAGEVTLSGELAPASVLVENSAGNDYSWVADAEKGGKLTGDMTLTKRGAGLLSISSDHDYTGGTLIAGGTVTARSAAALGQGMVTLETATLQVDADGFSNTISSRGASNLEVTEGHVLGLKATVQNEGTLTLSGAFDVSALTLESTEATHIDTTGRSGASGFAQAAAHTVTLATGTTADAGASITHGDVQLKLGTDGTATAGGAVNYSTYLLTGTDTASTSDIHSVSANAAYAAVSMNGGTLTVNDIATVTAEGGTLKLEGGTLNGSLTGTGLTATSGNIDATFTGNNSITGNGYMLTSVLRNSGTLTLSGSFDVSKLAMETTEATHIDTTGRSGASGFAQAAAHTVTLATGTTADAGASITRGDMQLKLGTDGTATAGGAVNYSTYYLTGTDAATTSDIHSSNANAANAEVSMSGGTLTVNDTATVTATGGTLKLEGGTLNGSLSGTTLAANSGNINATFTDTNTITGNGYMLTSVLRNSGELTLSGSFDVSKLTLNSIDPTLVGVDDTVGTSGFRRSGGVSVTIATGTTVNDNATITHRDRTLTLGTNGIATAAGSTDYGTYYLTGTDAASTSAIHGVSANAEVSMNGGTLTVNDTVSVTATGGTLLLTTTEAALSGSLTGTSLTAESGNIDATFTGNNSITGNGYMLTSVLRNSGTLTLSGSFDVSKLAMETTEATHIDTTGRSGASGFAQAAAHTVTLATGTTANAGASITRGDVQLTLGTNGTATAGGAVNYSTYYLTGTDAASTSDIHSSNANAANAEVSMSGGTLTVNDTASVTATGGDLKLEGGTLNGSLSGTTLAANSGNINATFTGNNTITGNGYMLTSVLRNSGELTLSGSFDVSKLTLNSIDSTLVGVDDTVGTSGFRRSGGVSVTIATGTTVNDNATITHRDRTLTLGTNGIATAAGSTDYGTYYLTGTDAASTSAIHGVSANAEVSMDGGTLTVDDTASVTATGGTLLLTTTEAALSGSLSGTCLTAESGNIDATFTGTNSITGNGYMLTSVLRNSGTLTLSGSFDVSKLAMETTEATHIDTTGRSGASGFAQATAHTVTLATGTTADAGASITRGDVQLTLGTNGTATAGGAVNYSTYYLTGTDAASTSDIHSSNANAANAEVSMSGGTLTVNDTASVTATGGTLKLEGGTLNGSLSGTTLAANSGNINATFTDTNTITGNGYMLTSVLRNSGELTLSGSFDVSKLTPGATVTPSGFVGVDGNTSTSGFAVGEKRTVTLASGTTVDQGAIITDGVFTYQLGTNGTATYGGGTDYGTYHLTGTDTASTSAIHRVSANAEVSMDGGTLTVNDTVSVTATGGALKLEGGTLNGSLTGTTLAANSGNINATFTDTNTITGNGYMLTSMLRNSGELTLSGSFDVSKLTPGAAVTPSGFVGVDGNTSTSGFAVGEKRTVTLASGTTVDQGATITDGVFTYQLGTDGTATAGGAVDYSTYHLTGSDTATTSDIHRVSANAAVSMNGGTLIVNDTASVTATGGTLRLEGGTLDTSATNTLTATSLVLNGGTLNTRPGAVSLSGKLSILGATTINLGELTEGDYTVLSAASISGSTDLLSLAGDYYSYTWDVADNALTLHVVTEAPVDPDPVTTDDVVLSGNGDVTNDTVISGNAKVEVNGKGTLTLTQANSYTGGTTIKSGTLVAGADGALGKGDVTIYGGKLDIGGHALPDNKVWVKDTSCVAAGNSGSMKSLDLSTPGARDGDGTQLFGGVLALTGTLELESLKVGTGAVSGGSFRVSKSIVAEGGTIAANLSGTATFTKSGRATLTLKGRNSWTGRTTINEGRLVIAGQSTVSSLDFNGGSLAITRSGSLTVTDVFSVCGHEMELSSPITLCTSMDGNLLDLLRANGCEAQNENGTIVFRPGTPAASVAMLLADTAEENTVMTEESADASGDETAASSGEAADAKAAGEAVLAAIVAAEEPAPSVGTDALAQGTWGVAKAARLFVDTVRDHAGMGSAAALNETGTRSAWFCAMSTFSRTDSKGVAAGADTDIYGGALGMQFNGSRGGNAGIAVGQTWGHISPMGGSSRVTQKTQHAALYANKVLVNRERDFAGVSATAAYATTDSDTVQDGHRFDWAQQSAVLGLRGTWIHHISNATAVYCYTGAEYLATDSAATENAESGSVQSLKWEAGAGVSHTAGKLTVYADAAFRPDIVRHNPVAESDGQRGGVSNPGRLEFRATVGADYRVDEHWSINAGYSYEGAARENNHNLRAGVGYTF